MHTGDCLYYQLQILEFFTSVRVETENRKLLYKLLPYPIVSVAEQQFRAVLLLHFSFVSQCCKDFFFFLKVSDSVYMLL